MKQESKNAPIDFYRKMDAAYPVFASGDASPARGTAPPPGKHLSAYAHQNSSQPRIQRLDREACDEIEASCGRVFAEQTRKDHYQAAPRHVPVGEAAPYGRERRRAPRGRRPSRGKRQMIRPGQTHAGTHLFLIARRAQELASLTVKTVEGERMCPLCIESTAAIVAGAGSAGGILAVCIGRFRNFFRANRFRLFQK